MLHKHNSLTTLKAIEQHTNAEATHHHLASFAECKCDKSFVEIYAIYTNLDKQEKKGKLRDFFQTQRLGKIKQTAANMRIFFNEQMAINASRCNAEPHVILKLMVSSTAIFSANQHLYVKTACIEPCNICGYISMLQKTSQQYQANPHYCVLSEDTITE